MDNERPNEQTLWSRRLEEPGALPGVGLADKEAAWDKLYDRLKGPEARSGSEESRRRKKAIWLWAAAACILLLIVPTALLLRDGHAHFPAKIPVGTYNRNKSDMEPVTPADKQSVRPASPAVTIAPPTSGRRESPSRKELTPVATRPSETHPFVPSPHPDLNKLFVRNTDTMSLVFAPRPDLSKPLATATSVPPKKELRIVHINELDPPHPVPSTVKGQRLRPGGLHIELTPEGAFRPSTTYIDPETPSPSLPSEPLLRWPKGRH